MTKFGTNRKSVYDCVFVNNTNLSLIMHRFQVIADYWSDFRRRQRVPLFTTLVQGEPLNLRLRNLTSKNENGLKYMPIS